MHKFLIKIISLLSILSILSTFFLYFNGGYIDSFYDKFTTPKQFSLIIGDSRAKNGILPAALDSCFKNTKYKIPTYNFSFTVMQSIYGPSYLESIKRKLNSESINQLFILQVSPWILANRDPLSKNESDANLIDVPPHNMQNMTSNPNIEYLIKNFEYFNFKGIFRKHSFLSKDGHSEYNKLPKNQIIFQEWKKTQLKMFQKWEKEWTTSEYRISWLENTIEYLQQYGTVYVLRMPFDEEYLEIENRFWPGFDSEMKKISKEKKINYLNYSKQSDWSTFDGHHLDIFGAKSFSITLSNDIKELDSSYLEY